MSTNYSNKNLGSTTSYKYRSICLLGKSASLKRYFFTTVINGKFFFKESSEPFTIESPTLTPIDPPIKLKSKTIARTEIFSILPSAIITASFSFVLFCASFNLSLYFLLSLQLIYLLQFFHILLMN